MPDRAASDRHLRWEGRAGGLVALSLLLAIAAVGYVGRGAAPPVPGADPGLPDAPFADLAPDYPIFATHPDLKLMGIEPAATHTPLCTEGRTAAMTASFAERADDGVVVDVDRWEATGWGGRAGYASFWSKCFHGGATVHIRSERDGALLAIYDPATGLDLP